MNSSSSLFRAFSACALLLLCDIGLAQSNLQWISSGVEARPQSTNYWPQISGNGRFVLYRSRLQELGVQFVVHDRMQATQVLASVSESGEPMNHVSQADPSLSSGVISDDGRFVAFDSTSTNLVAGTLERSFRVYLRDVLNNSTSLLASVEGGSATYPRADRNLERIVYVTWAPGSAVQILNLYERSTGEVRPLLELATTGLIGAQQAFAVSGDGRYLVFGSSSDNFVPEDQNGRHDVFRLDIDSGEIVRVSVDATGVDSGAASFGGRISDNGLRVAFRTTGGNWLPMGAPGSVNGFVKDLLTGELILANSYDGFPVGEWLADLDISGDGSTIVFRGVGAADTGENGLLHVYRRRLDEARTQMVDVNALGFSSNGDCHLDALNPPILSNTDQFNPSLSDDGRQVVFSCQASNLLPEAGSGMHVYVRTFAGAPPLSAPVPIPADQRYAILLLLGLVGGLGMISIRLADRG